MISHSDLTPLREGRLHNVRPATLDTQPHHQPQACMCCVHMLNSMAFRPLGNTRRTQIYARTHGMHVRYRMLTKIVSMHSLERTHTNMTRTRFRVQRAHAQAQSRSWLLNVHNAYTCRFSSLSSPLHTHTHTRTQTHTNTHTPTSPRTDSGRPSAVCGLRHWSLPLWRSGNCARGKQDKAALGSQLNPTVRLTSAITLGLEGVFCKVLGDRNVLLEPFFFFSPPAPSLTLRRSASEMHPPSSLSVSLSVCHLVGPVSFLLFLLRCSFFSLSSSFTSLSIFIHTSILSFCHPFAILILLLRFYFTSKGEEEVMVVQKCRTRHRN